jgi:hypothetical protein
MILEEMVKTDIEWLAEQDADFKHKGKYHHLRKVIIYNGSTNEFIIDDKTNIKLVFEDE